MTPRPRDVLHEPLDVEPLGAPDNVWAEVQEPKPPAARRAAPEPPTVLERVGWVAVLGAAGLGMAGGKAPGDRTFLPVAGVVVVLLVCVLVVAAWRRRR